MHQWQQDRSIELINRVRQIFKQFAGLYDSDLFPAMMDPWDQIWVDSDLLAKTITGLYDVHGDFARYDFNVIDADVIGQVYEQYLGYIGQVAKEEVKRQQRRLFPEPDRIEIAAKIERRKAGGIYYTPKWVTNLIVRLTLGKYIEEKNRNDIENISILDPACGSGSFLIRAYDELLNYHARINEKSVVDLDWTERMEVLTRNIFGVDLDPKAVEIARLNLLLRALAERKSLPPLTSNIQRGNSLIWGNEKTLRECFGANFIEKRPFNWKRKFPDIMKRGGFDIIIGNPPYVNEARGNAEIFRELKQLPHLQEYYEKNMDLFNYFIEIGLDLLREGGLLGYIIPAYWKDRTGASKLREKINIETNIEHLVNLGEFKVFVGAPGQHNHIIILRKVSHKDKTNLLSYTETLTQESKSEKEMPPLTEPTKQEYRLVDKKFIIGDSSLGIFDKLREVGHLTLFPGDVMRGVDAMPATYQGRGVFVLSEAEYTGLCMQLNEKHICEFFRPFYEARQIDRYNYNPKNKHWLLYTDLKRRLLLENEKDEYKPIVEHLDNFKDIITSDNKPYGLHRPKKDSNFSDKDKILFVRKSTYPKFALVPIPYYVDESTYIINWRNANYDIKYPLAIFNSTLAKWWFKEKKKHGNQIQIDKEQIISFPIRGIAFNQPSEVSIYNEIIHLADRMIMLIQKRVDIQTQSIDILGEEREKVTSEISETDQRIDQLVYGLYGLNDEDIAIINSTL